MMIILITGASHTGKTALAQKLLEKYINNANLNIKTKYETEFAHIFIAEKQ